MKKRNFGLDVLRAFAIIFVLFNHVLNYFIIFPNSTVLGDISGLFGVELFFVLSGFLIGRIVLTDFADTMQVRTVGRFYLRRWFRTLPLYYLLLIAFIAVAVIATNAQDYYPMHFVFLQNFSPESLKFFSVSWSLAIEEWFYFLLPILLFVGLKIKLFTKRTMVFLFVLVMLIMSVRFFYVLWLDPTFDDIRKHVFLRFDSLLIGVLLAASKLYNHSLYKDFQKISRLVIALVFIGVLALSYAVFWNREELDTSFFAKVFAFPLLSFLIAMMIPFFETNNFINGTVSKKRILRWCITWISILSYSIYLIHLTVFDGVRAYFHEKTQHIIDMPIALLLTVLSSVVLYFCIEKPFMWIRGKIARDKKNDLALASQKE